VKKFIIAFILVFIPGICVAATHINIPWEEFKTLYKESIEKSLLAKQATQPSVFSIDSASYKIGLAPEGGTGSMMIQGRFITGNPEPISLFNKNIIIPKNRTKQGRRNFIFP